MVKSSLPSLILLLFLLPVSQAQLPTFSQDANRSAYKFLEYGDVNYENAMAYLDNYALELLGHPGSRGSIIVYRGHRDLPGTNHRYAIREKNYLVNDRGVEAERIVTVDGGVGDTLRVELWVVPKGATLPSPLQSSHANQLQLISPVKYDVQYHPLPHDTKAYDEGEDDPAMLDGYANLLKAYPDLRAYIIGYALYCASCRLNRQPPDQVRDAPGIVQRMLREKRVYLVSKHGIDPSRIVIIDGGYRKVRVVELWLVPKGAPSPKPTPANVAIDLGLLLVAPPAAVGRHLAGAAAHIIPGGNQPWSKFVVH